MKPPRSKWEALLELDLKPKTLEQHLVDEAAKLLAKELAEFPPPSGGLEDPRDEARFAPLFVPGGARPGPGVYQAAFHLARLEVLREIEEIDLYMRQQKYLPLAPGERDKLAMLFVSRWLVEQCLALKDALHTKLSRQRLADVLEQTERRLLGPVAHA